MTMQDADLVDEGGGDLTTGEVAPGGGGLHAHAGIQSHWMGDDAMMQHGSDSM